MIPSHFLDQYSTESLKVMARRRGLPEASSANKAHLISFLGARLFSREANRRLVESLPGRQKQLLAALKTWGNEAETLSLAAAVDGDPAEIAGDIQALIEMGLLLYPAEGRGRRYRLGECERVWMDRTAADAVEPLKAIGSVPKLLASSPPVIREGSIDLLLADLFVFLERLERHPFHPPGAAGAGSNAWDELARSLLLPYDLGPGDPLPSAGRPFFLYVLLDEIGLLKVRHGRLTAAEEAGAFFHLDRPAQARRIFVGYEQSQGWNEFERIPELVRRASAGRGGEDHYPSAGRVTRARARTLAALRRFDPERWYDFSSLCRELKSNHPGFLVKRLGSATGAGHHYAGIGERGARQTSHALNLTLHWDRVEGRFLARVLLEPLHWLGMVDLGFEERVSPDETRLDAFRITPTGAHLLGLSQAFPSPPDDEAAVLIEPDFTLMVLSASPPTSLLYELSRFAEFSGGDRLVRFTMTRESARRGFRVGWGRERIAAFLDALSHGGVPQNVVASLAAWERADERFRLLKKVRIVEDPEGVLEPSNTGSAPRELPGELLAPGVRRVSREAMARLAHEATRDAITITRFDYAAANGSVLDLGPELAIRQTDRGRDWATTATLERVAEETRPGAGEWRLSRPRVKASLKRGFSLESLLNDLERRSRASSGEIRLAMRAWTGALSEIGIAPRTVFSCPDQRGLALILDSPSLAPFLSERLGPQTFSVAPGQATAFKAALRRLGLKVAARAGTPAHEAATPPMASSNGNDSPLPFVWRRPREGDPRLVARAEARLRSLLGRACEVKRKVRVDYFQDPPGRIENVTLSPLLVEELVLAAWSHERRIEQSFRLDRILALELLPERS